jgi:uncharacterized membrane protein YphA (DoxX/SURF4 family)
MRRLTDILEHEIDPRPLALARILVGLAIIVKFLSAAPEFGHFHGRGNYVAIPYPVQVPVVEGSTAILLVILLWGFGVIFFTLGLWTRPAGVVLTVSMLYALLSDQQMYGNHFYLLITLTALLTFANSGARFSLDAWNSNGADSPATVPAWPVPLLKLQLTSVYLFAGLSKINADFFAGHAFATHWRVDVLEQWTGISSLEAVATMTVVVEIFLALGFWLPRVRWVALACGVGFHAVIVATLGQAINLNLIVFGLAMFALYVPFFSDVALRYWPARRAIDPDPELASAASPQA